jgi:uncharacterized membrane protein YedE/YeeE
LSLALLAFGFLGLLPSQGARLAALYLLGAAFGVILVKTTFGFAGAWRAFIKDGRGAGLRAQFLAFALASLLFLPALEQGSLFGTRIVGAVAPVGLSVLVGAGLFGLGMQLAGGCASGTLFALGLGSTRMLVVLPAFMAGSLLGAANLPWWLAQPSLGSISLAEELGLGPALLLQLVVLGLLAWASGLREKRRRGEIESWRGFRGRSGLLSWREFLVGPWSLLTGAVLLALMNFATLALAGHPWTIAFGYTLWGAKIASLAGVDFSTTAFWTWPGPAKALAGSLFANNTSLMNMGIIVGAALAAGLAGTFGSGPRGVGGALWRPLLAAVLGGVLMGYGARLAFGCNVGALFSGIASGSLHGWMWLICGMAGSLAGVALRPWFALELRTGGTVTR